METTQNPNGGETEALEKSANELKTTEEEEKQQLENYITDLMERLEKRSKMRELNIQASKDRPELNTSKLDSSLKKNTAFIKKLKNLTESQEEVLEKELIGLNLTRYISEVAQAITEAKLKMCDIHTAISLCSLLHQRYQDFDQLLFQSWQKLFTVKKDEKLTNLSKLRVDLRFYAELASCGIFSRKEGLPLLGNVLTTLVNNDKEEHQNMSVIVTFCRHCGEEYMGLIPRRFRLASENFKLTIPQSNFLPKEKQKNVRGLMREYFNSVIKHLISDHKELFKLEQKNMRILQTKGELSDERKTLVETMSISLSKLTANANLLSDLLDEDIPEMPKWKVPEEEEGIIIGELNEGEPGETSGLQMWEDEDTKAFYTNLPNLKALLPSILYSESEKATSTPLSNENVNDEEEAINFDEEVETKMEEEEALPPELPVDDEVDEPSNSSSNRVLLEGFLNSLTNCISRDLIDSAALEFCLKLNTKYFRKKLIKALFTVSRTRLDLLPFYSRLVASLQPLMPDLATDLATMLKQDFRYQVRKKDQINIESKIKVVRFIGELTKFEVFPKSETLSCLRMLLQDFQHHHIEMACNLLETCGRFLYRSSDSHHRTKIFLEQMMRKKTVKSFDPRYNTMIENAYYYVNPPEISTDAVKDETPPMQRYIRYLLYFMLNKANTERIIRQIRKLHWEDPETSNFAVRCLTEIWHAKYYNIRCVASLLAGLIAYYDWIGPAVVDGVLEDIRLGLEVSEPKYNQRRVASVKYLGELYNYRVIESSVIFKVLYSLITFGVSWDPAIPSIYDPPDQLMRIRLVCTLIDTSGQFFSSGLSKRRLDCFLTYFQHYYWFKKAFWPEAEFPWQVDHMVQDSIYGVRPKMQMFKDSKEAADAVSNLNQQIVNKAVQTLPILKQYMEDDLQMIPEEGDENMEDDMFVDVDDEDDERPRGVEAMEDWNNDANENLGDGLTGEGGDSLTPSQHSQPSREDRDEEDTSSGINLSLKNVACAEDDDFMSAFDRMISDNLLERTRDAARPTNTQITVPIKASMKKTYDQIVSEDNEGSNSKSVVNFMLLTRSGNKSQCNSVEMPLNSDLVSKLRSREEEEKAEKERVKQLTLEINERQEEEEALEMMQGPKQPLSNFNRERRPRYQHPKGVPDADLIFG